MSTPISSNPELTSILFRGNDIDGWMSAYFVACACNSKSHPNSVRLYPCSPHKLHSWPTPSKLYGTNIIMTSVTPPFDVYMSYVPVAKSIHIFEHHRDVQKMKNICQNIHHDENSSSTLIAFKYFMPHRSIPDWVGLVDRLTHWSNLSEDDLAIREILHPISCLALNDSIEKAIYETISFLRKYSEFYNRRELIIDGLDKLHSKYFQLKNIINRGYVLCLNSESLATWNLPENWIGKKVFVVNTSGIIIDTSSAAHLIFGTKQEVDIFVNYRIYTRYVPSINDVRSEFVYSIRARRDAGIDLTQKSVFAGNSLSAGAKYFAGTDIELPFIE